MVYHDQYSLTIWQVKTALANEQEKGQKLSTDLDKANSTIEQLRKSSSSLTDILQEEVRSLKSSSEQLQTELAGTKQSLETSEQRFAQSSAQLQSAQQGLLQSKSEVEEVQGNLARTQEALKAATKEKQVLDLTISSLREDIEVAKTTHVETSESTESHEEVRVTHYV